MAPADIREARRTLGLTGEQMARMLGYGSTPRVYELEAGKVRPSECILRLLRAYLDGYRPADWPTK